MKASHRITLSHLKVYQRNTEKMNIENTQAERSDNIQNNRVKCKVRPLARLDL